MSGEVPAAKPSSGFFVRMEVLSEQNVQILEKLEELAKEVHQLETAVKVDLARVHGKVESLEGRLAKMETRMETDGRRGALAVAGGGAAGGGLIAAVAELVRHLLQSAG